MRPTPLSGSIVVVVVGPGAVVVVLAVVVDDDELFDDEEQAKSATDAMTTVTMVNESRWREVMINRRPARVERYW